MTRQNRICRLALCILGPLFVASCVVPIPTKKRIQSPTAMKPERVDISFIKIGSTPRKEVLEKLAWADVGINRDRLFLARWASSRWFLIVAGPGGGSGGATPWRCQNLLVEFDEKGIVDDFRPLRDEDLARELLSWLAKAHPPPLDLPKPMVLPVVMSPGGASELTLGRDYFAFQNFGKPYRIAPQEILGVQSRSWDDPAYIELEITLAKGSRAARHLSVAMRPIDALTMLQYLTQTRSAVPSGQ